MPLPAYLGELSEHHIGRAEMLGILPSGLLFPKLDHFMLLKQSGLLQKNESIS